MLIVVFLQLEDQISTELQKALGLPSGCRQKLVELCVYHGENLLFEAVKERQLVLGKFSVRITNFDTAGIDVPRFAAFPSFGL